MERSRPRLRAAPVLLLTPLLFVGGCKATVDAEAPVGPVGPYVADDVVFRIDEFSDMWREPPEPARMPTLIVYGDGRVIHPRAG